MIIDDVVVLPWVPATPSPRRSATIAASTSARRSTGMPRVRAACTSTFCSGTALLTTTASSTAPRFSARWGTAALHAEQAQPVESGVLAHVRPGHVMAELGQHRGVRAHARAARADHVDPARLRQVDAQLRRHGHTPRPARRLASAASGRPNAACRGRHRRPSIGIAEQRVEDGLDRVGRARRVGHRDRAAPASTRTAALASCWPWAAPDQGTNTAGTPTAATSATVVAPERHSTSALARVQRRACRARSRRARRRGGPRAGAARRDAYRQPSHVLGTRDVPDDDVGRGPPAVVEPERDVVEPARALSSHRRLRAPAGRPAPTAPTRPRPGSGCRSPPRSAIAHPGS